MEHLKYPIGRFDKEKSYSLGEVEKALEYLEAFPQILEEKLKNLSAADLQKVYRPEGWNIRQLVHHLADSHSNMYVRVKLALTEENPTISGYNEAAWAMLADYDLDIEYSINQLKGLHKRIVHLLRNTEPKNLERTYFHSGYKETYVLRNVIVLYYWHSRHHLEHINLALGSV